MFKVRVIPCLDVKDGRVVKGVNFVDLRDAGDPVEAAIAYDAAGADELCFLDITATHENRGTMLDVVQAHRGSLLHAADGRRRRAHRRRHPHAAAIRRRQGFDQHAPRSAAANSSRRRPKNSAISASWSRSTPRACQARRRRRALGDLHPWRAQSDRHRCHRICPGGGVRSAPAKSCSPRWTATAPGRASTLRSRARSPTACRCR